MLICNILELSAIGCFQQQPENLEGTTLVASDPPRHHNMLLSADILDLLLTDRKLDARFFDSAAIVDERSNFLPALITQ
jgi:hypothetical protein